MENWWGCPPEIIPIEDVTWSLKVGDRSGKLGGFREFVRSVEIDSLLKEGGPPDFSVKFGGSVKFRRSLVKIGGSFIVSGGTGFKIISRGSLVMEKSPRG